IVCAFFLASHIFFCFSFIKFPLTLAPRLSGHLLQNTTQIFAAPSHIAVGQALSPSELASYLQREGYRPEKDDNALGQYTVQANSVDIRPSKLSYFGATNALTVQFTGKTIRAIRPLGGGAEMSAAEIEPEPITNLFDSAREKRRPIRYEDIPPVLVHAIISAEDKRFFEHGGFDFVRIAGAAWADLRHSSN